MLRALGYRRPLAQPWLRLAALALTIVIALALSAGTYAAARAIISITRPQPTATPTSPPTATPAAVPIAIDGRIEQLAQERWLVGGRAVVLSSSTVISGTPALNAIAHVRGNLAPSGTVLALGITIEPIAATPTNAPTATPSPTPTTTPSPTATPTAIPTAIPAAPPAPPAPQPAVPRPTVRQPAAPPGDNQQHTCQGQQLGRDDKKCDPKPKKPSGKQDNQKQDKDKKDKNGG
jgi:hypothetical protein